MPIWSKNFLRAPLILLAAIEATILFVSAYFPCTLAQGDFDAVFASCGAIAPKALTSSFVILMSIVAMGLYQFHNRIYFHEVIVRLVVGIALGSIVLTVIYYAIPPLRFEPPVAAMSALSALVFLLLTRYIFMHRVDQNVFRLRTLIYGSGQGLEAILKLRRRADRRGFQIVGTVSVSDEAVCGDTVESLAGAQSLLDLALEKEADEIVVALEDRRGNLPIRQLLDCRLRGITVIDLPEFLERETGKIQVDFVSPSWLVFSPGFRLTRLRSIGKRALDIFVGFFGIMLALPIMIVVIVAIKLEDGLGAPIIYRQRRVGHHGDVFDVLKFRSMHVDAEPDGKAVWADQNDSRITRVGSVIRSLRIDELPQIFNVLRGQMSFVGPRPERPEFVEQLAAEIPYYSERHTVKPGVTGWAQLKYVYGSSTEGALEKLRYDLYYVKNHSLLLDLLILLQTVEVVLWGKGAR